MRKFHFIAMNRQGQVIYKSPTIYNTNREALSAGCVFLQGNFEVKEISVR